MKTLNFVFGTALFAMAVFTGWLIWCPVLRWALAQFPADAAWYGAAKVATIVLIGWVGGVGVPFFFFILGMCSLFWDFE